METRNQFRNELEELNKYITRLATLSHEALEKAISALHTQNLDKANQVVEDDKHIDRAEIEINDKAVLLIAKQQPVATDLRKIINALRIVTDIERMADNAKNIANSAIKLGKNEIKIPDGINKMYEIITEMHRKIILAFENEDITIAKEIGVMDDKVDSLYNDVVSELLGETATKPEKVQYVMQIAFSARYLERYADHITNIGESILYLVRGENYSLN
ncbi:phosphate signaling complex protein PhoU [Oceanobacillus senegalensis]|uniref:phosphate signaling complex protein PhoU n=1 Tax=Oceanobacillus senegalensis TaxID=1936063 RepID=UPI000A3131B9|nr:phosphate signaling complex protein PhoU [Oceanobacillus senegalensis]